jgi:hypothetical protein
MEIANADGKAWRLGRKWVRVCLDQGGRKPAATPDLARYTILESWVSRVLVSE